jgi:hypothetical protein
VRRAGMGALERTALLDVQLQVGSEIAGTPSGMTERIRITTEGADPKVLNGPRLSGRSDSFVIFERGEP